MVNWCGCKTPMANIYKFSILTIVAGLAGCTQAPEYHPPVIDAPAAFKEAGPWVPAMPAAPAPTDQWWQAFGDPVLDRLEAQIDTANPTLSEALGRYDAARAYLGEARSQLYPSLGLGAQPTENRQSNTRPLRGSNQPDLYAADTMGGSFGYELDLWGRVRNEVAANRADVAASADDVAAIRLSLEAELATDYIALRGLDQEIDLLTRTVDAYAKADALTHRRFVGGIANGIDVARSGTQLSDAQAQLADASSARALLEHAIASLIGTPASSFSIATSNVTLTLPGIPLGLPSTLLQRRPDVAAAERRMYVANRGVGIARSAFFPSISLGGIGGFQSTALSSLIAAPNIFWSVGPNILVNLFDGGKRRARVALAGSEWTQATSRYRETVLIAFQQVEDGLSKLHHLGDESAAERRAAIHADEAEALAYNRYVKGASNYLDVVIAQTAALTVSKRSIQIETSRLEANVSVLRALGGGWQRAA